mgnify:FL=1
MSGDRRYLLRFVIELMYTEGIILIGGIRMKDRIIGAVAIVAAWFLLDIVFHGMLLVSEYEATAHLWRGAEGMDPIFNNVVAFVTALIFILVYTRFVSGRSMDTAIRFGAYIGLLVGVGFGIASYGWMPITPMIAGGWAVANLVKYTVAGAITGYFIKS